MAGSIAFVLAILSAACNGTFSMLGKLCKEAPDPVIFNFFVALGALLSSLLAPLLMPAFGGNLTYGWTWPGALAGALFVLSTLFSFIAIPLSGLAASAATWSCSAMIVSFLWGAIGPQPIFQPMSSVPLSMVAIVLLAAGVLILNLSPQIAALFSAKAAGEKNSSDPEQGSTSDSSVEQKPMAWLKVLGLISAMTVGLFGGSVLVPASYVEPKLKGLNLLPSFGASAALVGFLVAFTYWLLWRRAGFAKLWQELSLDMSLKGIAAGVIWNLGNICQVITQNSLGLAYGIAYPLLQCGLLFAGMWGIYYFKEVTSPRAILVFWIGALVLIGGAILLGLFGPGSVADQ